MKSESLVVFADTIFDQDIVTDLPGDPVAVVVFGSDSPNRDPIAVLQENTAGVVAVEMGVVLAIAVESKVFDRCLFDELSA